MSNPAVHHQINYVEFTTPDVARAKRFYNSVFGWSFQDYGADYASFNSETAGLNGGFMRGEAQPAKGVPLVVIYSKDLSATEAAVKAAGGGIAVPTFEFPGGRRFHFNDGLGNVLAVWSE